VPHRLIVIAALFAGLAAPSAYAQDPAPTLLAPGITYERQVEFTPHGPVVLHVTTTPRPDGSLYRLTPVLSNGAVVATDRLTAMEKELAAQGVAVGVNGDYFDANPGDPKGIVIRDGALDSPPAAGRSSAGIGADGALQVARVTFNGIWRGTGQRRPLTINQPPAAGPVTLYTSAWGPSTPPEAGVVADVIPSLPPTRPNQDLIGTVSQVAPGGGVPIPPGGAVLVARGNQAPILGREAPVGTTLFLRLALTPDWGGMAGAIGGGPVLVRDGKPVFRANEDISGSLLNPRASRSAVGQLRDGRVLLVTTDGGLPGYSVGMTNFELALALVRLGAVQAMALGSGTSASMAFDGSLLSRPAGRAEAEISDALVLLYTGVYVPALSDTVISPNGDGVGETLNLSYRLARPSTVTATVVGARARQILDSGLQQPGLHTFTFAGKTADGATLAEGDYRFTVTATDDQGRQSSAERAFGLNETLAALTVSPATAQIRKSSRSSLAIAFTLSRQSTVTATIETRSGVVVRTLDAGKLPAGPQKLVWDGRTDGGSLAFAGAYVVRVAAVNGIGRIDLTQPFAARRG
jgi:flagellar hook assembly protein FlgD